MLGSRPESVYLKPAPPKRISLPSAQRLNTILERDQHGERSGQQQATELSERIQNARHSYLGAPPLLSDEKPPPRYSALSASSGSGLTYGGASSQSSRAFNSRQEEEDRAAMAGFHRPTTQRGGWKKLALIVAAVVLVVIALAVGLGVGLTRRNSGNNTAGASPSGSGSGNSASSSRPFPAGMWNFDVVLASVGTGCTSNTATWACPPYQTYGQSPTASRFTFTWNINQTAGQMNQFSISSGANVFAQTFGPAPLTLMNEGAPDERYTFSITVPKSVQPSSPITSNGQQALCYFNQTVLAGTLYTRNSRADGSSVSARSWPGTAYIDESSPGGMSVPDCYSSSGARVPLPTQPASTRCECIYESRNGTGTG